MKILKDLLYKVALEAVKGSTDIEVRELTFDSRAVAAGDLFIALVGTQSDGHQFIGKALDLGATCIVCQEFPAELREGITWIKVQDTQEALAHLAANFYGNPSNQLKLVGVTGTNGKTTVATLLYQLYKTAGYKTGLLSTVKIMVDQTEYKATHTTPDSITINRFLAQMVYEGVDYCFMEVSSHGIHQKRTAGLSFAGGIFTNLSHDHLDYHANFAEYRDVKKQFFDELAPQSFALTNIDDKNGAVMLQNTKARRCSYALKSMADYRAQILENQLGGLLLKVNDREVWVRLMGVFNAYNLLAIFGAAVELGMPAEEALQRLSTLESVSGRFQYVVTPHKITAVVDYAHTPDALENVLKTIDELRTRNEKVITLVGCGGDRDKTKRPIMAKIACDWSNQVILTSDNPRSEDPKAILLDMEKGVEAHQAKKTLTIEDRRQAIKTACQMAQPGDIILIAGKGHETYQEIQGIRHDFDDFKTVKEFLELS